jgi:hypothetical protein
MLNADPHSQTTRMRRPPEVIAAHAGQAQGLPIELEVVDSWR